MEQTWQAFDFAIDRIGRRTIDRIGRRTICRIVRRTIYQTKGVNVGEV